MSEFKKLNEKLRNYSYSVDSLIVICIEYVLNNLVNYISKAKEKDVLVLPTNIKDCLLSKFLTRPCAWRQIDFTKGLSLFVHPKVTHIDFTHTDVRDEHLSLIITCHNLQKLYVTRRGSEYLTETGLCDAFQHFKHLLVLCISNCHVVTDEVLMVIASNCLAIEIIDVGRCTNVSDIGLGALARLEHLKSISLVKTSVSNDGVMSLIRGPSGKNLKELKLTDCRFVNAQVLKYIAEFCPKMEILIFNTMDGQETSDEQWNFEKFKQFTWTLPW